MHLHRFSLVVALAACGADTNPADPPPSTEVTYQQDIKPILDAKCAGCHVEGGIGPFALTDYATAKDYAPIAAAEIANGTMPPWPPDADCRDYVGDRSLTAEQVDAFQRWLAAGTPEGDPATPGEPLADPIQSLTRVDATLAMPEPYTVSPPGGGYDDYRCFVLPWPAEHTQATYVTGFRARPGNDQVVHHVIAFLAPPNAVAEFQALDAAEAGPGYTCFGGSGGPARGTIGGWAPGSLGADLPAGVGLPVEPGSAIVLQVHYNTGHAQVHGGAAAPATDLTSIEVKLDASVARPGRILPFVNPAWLRGNGMLIPANDAEVVHSFAADPTPLIGEVELFTAGLHMHTLGRSSSLRIQRAGGGESCLLAIDDWNFHWQGSYGFAQPEMLRRGDKLALECRWDNSAPGAQDVVWGEGTGDEMCIAFLLAAAP